MKITITWVNTENGCDWDDVTTGIAESVAKQGLDAPETGQEGIMRNTHGDIIAVWEVEDE